MSTLSIDYIYDHLQPAIQSIGISSLISTSFPSRKKPRNFSRSFSLRKERKEKPSPLTTPASMADKNQNQYHPAEVNGYHRSDQESLQEAEEARRKKKMKWTIGIIAFVIFQVVQALFFVLVIMKFKSPKFRVADLDNLSLNAGNQTSPSFDMSFVAPIRIKNTNWGPFKYGASNVTFTYGDAEVGHALIPKSKANFKSTKKIDVNVNLSSSNLPTEVISALGSQLGSNVITLKSEGELKGKVTVMFMFKKNKISRMNCTMEIDTSTKVVKSTKCS